MKSFVVPAFTLALALAFVIACSSFGDEITPDTADGASDAPSAPDGLADGGAEASADPCEGKPGTTEVAGLWVVAGRTANVVTADVLRAPVLCDGSLGAWVTVAAQLQRPVDDPALGVVDDRMVLYGGQHSNGGAAFSTAVYAAGRDLTGAVGAFAQVAIADGAQRYRALGASDGRRLVVLGGLSTDAGVTDLVETVVPGTSSPVVLPGTPLPVARARGAAAIVGDRVFVLGGGPSPSPIIAAPIGPDGTVGAFTTMTGAQFGDFDVDAISANGAIYVAGGYGPTDRFDVITPTPDGTGVTLLTTHLLSSFDPGGDTPRLATFRGWVYVVGGAAHPAGVAYARLTPSGIDGAFVVGPSLPTGRTQHAVVVY